MTKQEEIREDLAKRLCAIDNRISNEDTDVLWERDIYYGRPHWRREAELVLKAQSEMGVVIKQGTIMLEAGYTKVEPLIGD